MKKTNSIKKSISIYVALLLLAINTPLFSQSLSDTIEIKEIKVIARQATKKEEAGVVKSIVDSLAVAKSLDASLSELIAVSTPVFIKNYGRGAMATASFRGTAPSHTQVSWNGININSPMLGMTDFSTIPVYFIDDVSLLHGAGSITETSGALGGSIQLTNKADWNNRLSATAVSGIGSYSTLNEYLQINMGSNKIQFKTRFFYNASPNNYELVNKTKLETDPETEEFFHPIEKNMNAEYENFGVQQEIYSRLNERNIVSVKYWYNSLSRGIPKLLSSETAQNSNINHQDEDVHRAVADWNRYGNNSKVSVKTGINKQRSDFWLTNAVGGSEDQKPYDSRSETSSWYNNAKYSYHFPNNLSTSFGLDVDYHSVVSNNKTFNTNEYGYNKSRIESSAFFQLSKKIGTSLSTNFIGRQSYYDNNRAPFIPSLGIEFIPLKSKKIKLSANIAKNHHQPTLNDLYYIPGGNPHLLPEKSMSSDFGVSYSAKTNNNSTFISINGHTSEIDNWIIWLPTLRGYWEPRNVKKVNIKGIEANFKTDGKINNTSYTLTSTYNLSKSINNDDSINDADESVGKQLPYIPVHSANILGSLSQNGFHLSYIWNYYSRRYTTTSNNDEIKDGSIYPYFMNNLYIGKLWQLNKTSFDIELKIYNLFNEEYRTVLYRPMPGRNYMLLLRIRI